MNARHRAAEQRDELAPFQWQHLPCFQPEYTTSRECGNRSFRGRSA